MPDSDETSAGLRYLLARSFVYLGLRILMTSVFFPAHVQRHPLALRALMRVQKKACITAHPNYSCLLFLFLRARVFGGTPRDRNLDASMIPQGTRFRLRPSLRLQEVAKGEGKAHESGPMSFSVIRGWPGLIGYDSDSRV